MKLLEMGKYLDKGFQIFIDNFFKSIPLARDSYSIHINMKGIPVNMKPKLKVLSQRIQINFWKSPKKVTKKQVVLLSTKYVAISERKAKKKGIKVWYSQLICLQLFKSTISYMSSVDSSDPMLYCYFSHNRQDVW